MSTDEIIQEVTRRLVEGFHPRRVILFGSQARGTADERSDVDLIVIMDLSPEQDRVEVSTRMSRCLRGLMVGCDIILFTQAEYDRERRIPGTAARYASREGKTLYARRVRTSRRKFASGCSTLQTI